MDVISSQPLLDRLTDGFVRNGDLDKFKSLTSCNEKVEFCYKAKFKLKGPEMNIMNEIRNLLEALYDKKSDHFKSIECSEEAKCKGTKAYCAKKDEEAISLYSECIRLAPAKSKVLSLAFANRSAVLLRTGHTKECLKDIERSIEAGYPDDLLPKLYIRKALVLTRLGKLEEAQSTILKCKESLESLPENKKSQYLSQMEDLKTEMVLKESDDDTSGGDDILHLYEGESQNVKYMSSSCDLRVTEEEGRHVISNKSIPRGSLVFYEDPFASVLLPPLFFTHCYCCYTFVINPLPCNNCCDIVFCSELCREKSSKWHKYECGLLHILTSVGISHLALRIILVAGWNICSSISKEDLNGESSKCIDDTFNGPDLTNRYKAVFSLLTHHEHALPEDQIQYALVAIYLSTIILEKTSLKSDWKEMSNDEISIIDFAGILMHHIGQLITNAHAITAIISTKTNENSYTDNISQEKIATAIYPTASMMNHSCKPNIISSFDKDRLIVHTIEDVSQGQPLHNNYGPHYCRKTTEERQRDLKQQYFFTCKCTACSDPQRKYIENRWSELLCEKCRGITKPLYRQDMLISCKCRHCKHVFTPSLQTFHTKKMLHHAYDEALSHFKAGDYSASEKSYNLAITHAETIYHPDNQSLYEMRDELCLVYLQLGNILKSCDLLSECCNYVKKRYGEYSVEYGHECIKYLDTLSLLTEPDITNEIELKKKELLTIIYDIMGSCYGKRWKKFLNINNLNYAFLSNK